MKYYFETKESEMCYSKGYFDKGTEVFEAIPSPMPGFFFCREYEHIGENGSCGHQCDGYTPKNGKSGLCKYRSNKMYEPGEKVTI